MSGHVRIMKDSTSLAMNACSNIAAALTPAGIVWLRKKQRERCGGCTFSEPSAEIPKLSLRSMAGSSASNLLEPEDRSWLIPSDYEDDEEGSSDDDSPHSLDFCTGQPAGHGSELVTAPVDEEHGEWRSVPGLDGAVLVSSEGWVKTRSKLGWVKTTPPLPYPWSRPYRGNLTDHGYRVVRPTVNGKQKQFHIHRLVALAFLGVPPSATHTIDHKDRNQENNKASNLRWATPSEQALNRQRRAKRESSRNTPVVLTDAEGVQTQFAGVNEAAKAVGTTSGSISQGAHKGSLVAGKYRVRHVCDDTNLPGEEWKRSCVSENLWISNLGRLQLCIRGNWRQKHFPNPNPRIAGYCAVNLTNTTGHAYLVHRLVKETFDGLPKNSKQYQIDHINRIRHDNRLSNLRWATPTEQAKNQGSRRKRTFQDDLPHNDVV